MTFTLTVNKTEDDLQRDVASFLDFALPPGCVFHHSPNEGKRHVHFINRLKNMGTKYGWPDLEIFCPANTCLSNQNTAIFIELKAKKGRLTENQKCMRDQIIAAGFPWKMCKSVEDVYLFLNQLIKLKVIM